jgi:hypothetical protein
MLKLLTPLGQVPRRSVGYDATINAGAGPITGRWSAINSSGNAVLPAAGAAGVYLNYEGVVSPKPGATIAIGLTPTFLPAPLVTLPSSVAGAQVALAYGIYRFTVDIEGFDPTSLVVGSGLQVDAVGRLVLLASGARVATVEAVTSTNLIARTLGA